MTVRLYVGSLLSDCPPLSCNRKAPEVSEEEVSYPSRFYRWFLEEPSFTSRGSARFNWHSCTVASLKVPAMIAYDVVKKVLETE